jgi:hypothetical protein
MLADQVEYVIGVDTHCDAHELAVVAASSGGVVAWSTPRHDRLHRETRSRRQDRREANRCLKRYLARSLYRLLEHPAMTT